MEFNLAARAGGHPIASAIGGGQRSEENAGIGMVQRSGTPTLLSHASRALPEPRGKGAQPLAQHVDRFHRRRIHAVGAGGYTLGSFLPGSYWRTTYCEDQTPCGQTPGPGLHALPVERTASGLLPSRRHFRYHSRLLPSSIAFVGSSCRSKR